MRITAPIVALLATALLPSADGSHHVLRMSVKYPADRILGYLRR